MFKGTEAAGVKKAPADIEALALYIESRYIPEPPAAAEPKSAAGGNGIFGAQLFAAKASAAPPEEDMCYDECAVCEITADAVGALPVGLDEALRMRDESFSEMLFRKIDELGLTDSECYRRAGIDRRHFSKLRSGGYHPGKNTVLALAIALRLPRDEMDEMLSKAGYALSRSSRADIIVDYYTGNGCYDIDVINEALFYYDERLLGS